MFGRWILRGNKTDRVLGAALIDGAFGALTALAKGKNPLIHGIAHAVAGADAMSNHRLVDRAGAHERNAKVADAVASVLEATQDQLPGPNVQQPPRIPLLTKR